MENTLKNGSEKRLNELFLFFTAGKLFYHRIFMGVCKNDGKKLNKINRYFQ